MENDVDKKKTLENNMWCTLSTFLSVPHHSQFTKKERQLN